MINMNIMNWLTKLLFIVMVPLLFITIAIRVVSSNEWFYERGFDTYQVAETTGLERSELENGAKGLITYFSSTEELISVQVKKEGKMIPLFNEREVGHLKDVKDLFLLANRIGEVSGLYLIAYALVLAARPRRGDGRRLANLVFQGSALTLVFLVLLGIGSLIDFEQLFVLFHVISFRNDLWMLNPSSDYLIMMFPEGFWIDAALAVGAIAVLQGLVAGGGAFVYLRKHRRNMASGVGMAAH